MSISAPISTISLAEPTPAATSDASATAASRHRGDIDGLRAIAVLAVVATHAGIAGFSGGYLGVDVFFVISGYLIHRDLVARMARGQFSLLAFYGRRMRRTMPALYLVVAATLASGLFVMMPGDLDALARSAIAALTLVPNIFFLTQTGYFDAGAIGKPLLHTWSLGVEEQFYLLAPLLPFALARLRPARRGRALLAGFCAAFALALAIHALSADAAFFLMPARIFEFLIGALVAEGLLPQARSQAIAEGVAIAALGALAWSITAFGAGTSHPGIATLVPCLATAALIQVGGTWRTVVGAALGLRAPAFVGLVSYSLYLWHWPLLALAHTIDWPLTPAHLAVGATLLLALSAASWRLIEQPFRDPASIWRRHATLVLPATVVGLVAASLLLVLGHGLPARFPRDVASVSAYYAYRDQRPFREGQCFITSKNRLADYDRGTCLALSSTQPNVLLLGDSHAAHLWTGLRDTWPQTNFLQATASGCKPLLHAHGPARCTGMMRDMFEAFIPAHHLAAIALGAFWEEPDVAALPATLEALRGKADRIVVFGPMPRYDEPLATLLAKAMLQGDPAAAAARHLDATTRALDGRLRAAVGDRAVYVSTYDAMCPGGRCRLFAAPGVPMQFDYHHLTPPGAAVMMRVIKAEQPTLFPSSEATR